MADFPVNIGEYFSLGSKTVGEAGEGYTVYSILSVVIRNLYVLVGIILLIMIFVGGIGMILNAGNTEAAKKSNQTLSSAVMGFGILIAAYWLVKIIEIIFGLTIFSPGGVTP